MDSLEPTDEFGQTLEKIFLFLDGAFPAGLTVKLPLRS
jgi:hypothetical protein